MPIILTEKAVLSRFEKDGLPQLLAYGPSAKDPVRKILMRRLREPATVWTFPLEAPVCGDVFAVTPDDSGAVKVFDCPVRLTDEKMPSGNVEIVHQFGGIVYGEKTNKPPTVHARPRTVELLLYSAGGITLLADAVDGPDCFKVVRIYPNDRLPMKFLLWRPERREDGASPKTLDVKFTYDKSDERAFSFAVKCETCAGSGEIDCEKCDATGVFKPQIDCPKCDGTGEFTVTCRKCDGDGEVTCRKCDGSGDHYSAAGNRYDCSACGGSGTWTCNSCDGDGTRDFECKACGGLGYLPEQPCFTCQGNGTVPCYACQATGHWSVSYDERTHTFTRRRKTKDGTTESKDYSPHHVSLYDWKQNTKLTGSGARAFLNAAASQARFVRKDRERREELCREFSAASTCLERSMEAEGSRIVDKRPFRLGKRLATKSRHKGSVIYEFSFVGRRPKWMKDKVYPFPIASRVELDPAPEFSMLAGENKPPVIQLDEVDFERGTVSLRIPIQCKEETIAEEFDVSPVGCVKPGEETQIAHLRRWVDPKNLVNPILGAMVASKSSSFRPDENSGLTDEAFFNQDMLKFSSQVQAVRRSLSDRPLVLLKGPPGTGKTTVITEIVRQAVKRGQRVLVTSQTHQAVQNVLERLHRLGNYRMVRHYSKNADPSKLTPLEREYTEQGGLGGTEEYFKKLDAVGENFRRKETVLVDAATKMKNAREADEQLGRIRTIFTNDKNRADREADAGYAAARSRCDTLNSKASARLDNARKTHDAEKKCLSREKTRLENQRASLETRISSLRERLNHSSNRQSTPRAARSGFRRWVNSLLPDFLSGAEELTNRLETNESELGKTRDAIQTNWQAFEKISRILDEEERLYEKDTKEANRQHDESCVQTLNERNKKHDVLTERFHGEESPRLETVRIGIESGQSVSMDIIGAAGPQRWDAPLARLDEQLVTLRKRLSLHDAWRNDALAEVPSVARYFDDRLQVFFSTCVGLASWRKIREKKIRFDIVVVDEAAHATMPETLIPILNGKRAVLVGDEKQLPPVVAADLSCREKFRGRSESSTALSCIRNGNTPCWLEESLFARLWDAEAELPRTMLNMQFRMHPTIGDFVSQTFYEGELKNGAKAEDRHAVFESFTQPVCLVPTLAYRKDRHEVSVDTSFRNPCEARLIAQILETANREFAASKNEKLSFGIVTPYAAQVAAIKQELKSRPRMDAIDFSIDDDIASVDKYQGSEKDIIVISFVRSPKPCGKCDRGINRDTKKPCKHCNGTGLTGKQLGFVRELRRLNVAFSRARRQLILVGDIEALHNPHFLGGEDGRQVFEDFYHYVRDKGRVLRVWEDDVHERCPM